MSCWPCPTLRVHVSKKCRRPPKPFCSGFLSRVNERNDDGSDARAPRFSGVNVFVELGPVGRYSRWLYSVARLCREVDETRFFLLYPPPPLVVPGVEQTKETAASERSLAITFALRYGRLRACPGRSPFRHVFRALYPNTRARSWLV